MVCIGAKGALGAKEQLEAGGAAEEGEPVARQVAGGTAGTCFPKYEAGDFS